MSLPDADDPRIELVAGALYHLAFPRHDWAACSRIRQGMYREQARDVLGVLNLFDDPAAELALVVAELDALEAPTVIHHDTVGIQSHLNPAGRLRHLFTDEHFLRDLVREGIDAFRLTREYLGDPDGPEVGAILPAVPGWSWFDWCEKAKTAVGWTAPTPVVPAAPDPVAAGMPSNPSAEKDAAPRCGAG